MLSRSLIVGLSLMAIVALTSGFLAAIAPPPLTAAGETGWSHPAPVAAEARSSSNAVQIAMSGRAND